MATFDSLDLEAILKIYNLPKDEISYNELKNTSTPDIIAAVSNNRGEFVKRYYNMNKPPGKRLYFKKTRLGKIITEVYVAIINKKGNSQQPF